MPPVPLRQENYEAMEEARSQYTSMVVIHRVASPSVISANQLSIYGAVADLCNEVPRGLRATVKPPAPDHLENMVIPTDLSVAENSTNAQET